ncbi:hypothetical protein cypCar_00047154, partial [Cyprinus carpio]
RAEQNTIFIITQDKTTTTMNNIIILIWTLTLFAQGSEWTGSQYSIWVHTIEVRKTACDEMHAPLLNSCSPSMSVLRTLQKLEKLRTLTNTVHASSQEHPSRVQWSDLELIYTLTISGVQTEDTGDYTVRVNTRISTVQSVFTAVIKKS